MLKQVILNLNNSVLLNKKNEVSAGQCSKKAYGLIPLLTHLSFCRTIPLNIVSSSNVTNPDLAKCADPDTTLIWNLYRHTKAIFYFTKNNYWPQGEKASRRGAGRRTKKKKENRASPGKLCITMA
jgi:hypothetical protein